MSLKLSGSWIRTREMLLLLALGRLLAFAFLPSPTGKTAGSVGHQIELLRTGSASERGNAAAELARMVERAPQAIVPVLIQAFDDKDAQVRLSVVNALHSIPPDNSQTQQTASTLIRALRDPDPRIRAAGAGFLSTLKAVPDEAIPALLVAARFEDESLAS